MPNDVILFPSSLPSAEKDLNLHSQTLAVAPADAAVWSVAHFSCHWPGSVGACCGLIQHEPNLGGRAGSGQGKDESTMRCCSPERSWGGL